MMTEDELRACAKRVASQCSQPTASVSRYSAGEAEVPCQVPQQVRSGLFGLAKKTVHITQTRTQMQTTEAPHDLQGWLLQGYYQRSYEVQRASGELYKAEEWQYLFILGRDGSLCVTVVVNKTRGALIAGGRDITVTERIDTHPMVFHLANVYNDGRKQLSSLVHWYSAYALDYTIGEWRTQLEGSSVADEYILRNYPFHLAGEGIHVGEGTQVYPQGEGLLARLKALESESPARAGPGAHSQEGAPARKKRKAGRNDPCPCGSGKKYKYCCSPEKEGPF